MSEPAAAPNHDPSDEELVAMLVERGVPERVARDRVLRLRRDPPTVIGRKGDPIHLDESEIDVWLSAGSFG